MKNNVLIVGAGPTGLVLALWLTKQGIPVRIIDKTAKPTINSRALGIQARTLELYQQMDLTDEITHAGHANLQLNLWVNGKKRGILKLVEQGQKLTPYPFLLIYPQDQHERILIQYLEKLGVMVERSTELISFSDYPDHVSAQIIGPQGKENYHAHFLAACDGGKSPIRHKLGLNFSGGTYSQVFYVADVDIKGFTIHGGAHISFDQHDFVLLLSYGKLGQARLIGIIREDRVKSLQNLNFEDINQTAIQDLGISIEKVNWFSTYHVHHRIVSDYHVGRVFLVGDAAHLHSPVGAQGMNTGIGDAINLAWKLAAVLKNQASEQLLESYQIERRAFAEKLIKSTDRFFSIVTAEGYIPSLIRIKIIPYLLPKIYNNHHLSHFIFRLISQLDIHYRHSPLSQKNLGKLQGGDRLPWIEYEQGNNFESLKKMLWQVHVYGTAQPQLQVWCKMNNIPLYSFTWDISCEQAGLLENAVYLLRPDTYIALIDPQAETHTLDRYFQQQQINCFSQI
ncbi:FAD-dependent monooxygenase [Acinetobacter sp. ANC 4648]|uniref:FAD-dependent monooxygenase n=1 Tax=Acinetobacter sp. ANC 4648 TaxID=1977875 RepID=UPI000A33C396|nr:FAD-dependent monooxygenase [Acinetobacter sp. ANC 4648]OTG83676.1 FAD-dependent oxidoreductase [Acinetobacter sp. ANC 4648]